MKKISLLVIATVLSVLGLQAQTPFVKGDKVISVGLGLGTYGVSGKTTIPPTSVSFDYGIRDNLFDAKSSLSVGGYLGYYATKSSFTYLNESYGWKYSNILLGVRGAVHYDFMPKLDTYAGLLLGYDIGSVSSYGTHQPNTYSDSNGGFLNSIFIGGRYYFTEKIAAFGEIGYGLSAIELGISFKL